MNEQNRIVSKHKPLPDIVADNLKVLFIGYNPGIRSAAVRHHYAGRGNRFWKLLYDSGLTSFLFCPEEDRKLLESGYGSTNIVDRPTRSAAEITPDEFREGGKSLAKLILEIKPRIACYVGIGVYRTFARHVTGIPHKKSCIYTGVQAISLIEGVIDFVCSNPSGLNTIPYNEQLNCFTELKKLVGSI